MDNPGSASSEICGPWLESYSGTHEITGVQVGNTTTITWSSDRSITNGGWEICIEPLDGVVIESALEVSSGPCTADEQGTCVQSPNFPDGYDNNEDCEIAVTGSGTLSSNTFETERNYDWLTINTPASNECRELASCIRSTAAITAGTTTGRRLSETDAVDGPGATHAASLDHSEQNAGRKFIGNISYAIGLPCIVILLHILWSTIMKGLDWLKVNKLETLQEHPNFPEALKPHMYPEPWTVPAEFRILPIIIPILLAEHMGVATSSVTAFLDPEVHGFIRCLALMTFWAFPVGLIGCVLAASHGATPPLLPSLARSLSLYVHPIAILDLTHDECTAIQVHFQSICLVNLPGQKIWCSASFF